MDGSAHGGAWGGVKGFGLGKYDEHYGGRRGRVWGHVREIERWIYELRCEENWCGSQGRDILP